MQRLRLPSRPVMEHQQTFVLPTVSQVVALVPAHNEEASIEQTVRTLLKQTYPVQRIIVICDNCTDNTEAIVDVLVKQYPRRLVSVRTVGNRFKKAGALNFGFSLIPQLVPKCKYVLQMDADTIVTEDIVEMAVKEFEAPPMAAKANANLGGVCCRFLVAKPLGKMDWLGKFLWYLQDIEYSFADAERVAGIKEPARVLSGTCSVYQRSVLEEVAKQYLPVNGIPQVWSVNSIVEDYTLTNDVRALRYETRCSYNMITFTGIPESFREYWRQRLRWYRGTIDELRHRGIKPYTIGDIFLHVFGLFITLTRIVFYSLLVYLITHHIGFDFNPIAYIITYLTPLVVYAYNIYRFQYIRVNRSWVQAVMVFTLIPLELYALLREVLMIRSYYLSFFRQHTTW